MKKPDEETKKDPKTSRTAEIRRLCEEIGKHRDGFADEEEHEDYDDEIYND